MVKLDPFQTITAINFPVGGQYVSVLMDEDANGFPILVVYWGDFDGTTVMGPQSLGPIPNIEPGLGLKHATFCGPAAVLGGPVYFMESVYDAPFPGPGNEPYIKNAYRVFRLDTSDPQNSPELVFSKDWPDSVQAFDDVPLSLIQHAGGFAIFGITNVINPMQGVTGDKEEFRADALFGTYYVQWYDLDANLLATSSFSANSLVNQIDPADYVDDPVLQENYFMGVRVFGEPFRHMCPARRFTLDEVTGKGAIGLAVAEASIYVWNPDAFGGFWDNVGGAGVNGALGASFDYVARAVENTALLDTQVVDHSTSLKSLCFNDGAFFATFRVNDSDFNNNSRVIRTSGGAPTAVYELPPQSDSDEPYDIQNTASGVAVIFYRFGNPYDMTFFDPDLNIIGGLAIGAGGTDRSGRLIHRTSGSNLRYFTPSSYVGSAYEIYRLSTDPIEIAQTFPAASLGESFCFLYST